MIEYGVAGVLAAVVVAVSSPVIGYHLSIDEYRAWERDFDSHGKAGLRSTRVGIYRKPPRTR